MRMRTWAAALLFAALQAAAAGKAASAADLTITTGGEKGTYYAFGKQIAEAAAAAGVTIDVETSGGSLENLERLLGYRGASENKFYQLAIVQADVLADLRRHAAENQVLERIVRQVKTVMPLYYEEVHIFARTGESITDMSDLANLVTGVGVPGSGTFMTARSLYRLTGLEWNLDLIDKAGGPEGVDALKARVIDALFQVAGAPTKLGQEIAPGAALTLLNITAPSIFDYPDSPFRRATLDGRTYGWLTGTVETAAVGSLLVAYNYEGRNCELIERVTRAIIQNLPNFKASGHEKWKEVVPEGGLNRSDLYECAARAF